MKNSTIPLKKSFLGAGMVAIGVGLFFLWSQNFNFSQNLFLIGLLSDYFVGNVWIVRFEKFSFEIPFGGRESFNLAHFLRSIWKSYEEVDDMTTNMCHKTLTVRAIYCRPKIETHLPLKILD